LRIELGGGHALTIDYCRNSEPVLSLWKGGDEFCVEDYSPTEWRGWLARALASSS
jgi:hypothetical protein